MFRISPRQLLRAIFIPSNPRRFLVALSIIGILASKGVHIYEHLLFEPMSLEFALFFPTFFIYDVCVLLFIVYCLYRPSLRQLYISESEEQHGGDDEKGAVSVASRVTDNRVFRFCAGVVRISLLICGMVLPLIIYFAASSEVSFYWQSGQQVMWSMTGRILKDPKSFTGMASEGTHIAAIVLVAFWTLARVESALVDRIIYLLPSRFRFTDSRKDAGGDYHDVESYYTTDDDSDIEEEKIVAKVNSVTQARRNFVVRRWTWAATTMATMFVILSFFRPMWKYDGVVTTVPLNMLEALEDPNHKGGNNEAFCGGGAETVGNGLLEFPYPELVSWGHHDDANSDTEWFANWLPENPPLGFERFGKKNNEDWRKWGKAALHDPKIAGKLSNALGKGKLWGKEDKVDVLAPPAGYHHAYDPLKFSNLHMDIHPELRAQNPAKNDNENKETHPLKDIKIRNIVVLTLESTRSQVFPVRNHTRFVDDIYKSRDPQKQYADPLSLTPNSARIAGKEPGKGGAGGVVMNGALTGAEFTLKSLLISHCGMNPLAIDFMEEMEGKQYQACIPQILKLLNANRNNSTSNTNSTNWRDSDWDMKYVQSVTTGFDRQMSELEMMGFNITDGAYDVIYKEQLKKANQKFPIPQGENELNYFGYREAVVKPYIRDMIRDARDNNRRLFLSHLTSSTHHPWTTPDKHWKKGTFMEDKERNSYINAVGFVDHWIGEFMDLLEEEKVADETLVVMLGDHGLSIAEGGSADSGRVSTFANPHINNFRIPIVLHHPHLPPVHVTANATNLSILPSILDMLLSSDSLSTDKESFDRKILSALRPVYEGQSLIRPMVHKTPKGLENYNFAVLNPGGTHLTVTSSDPATPYRIVMPLCQKAPYGVADLRADSEEEHVTRIWTTKELYPTVEKKYGPAARKWVERGIEVGRWWAREGRRRWNYSKIARYDDREKAKKEGNGDKKNKRDLGMEEYHI